MNITPTRSTGKKWLIGGAIAAGIYNVAFA